MSCFPLHPFPFLVKICGVLPEALFQRLFLAFGGNHSLSLSNSMHWHICIELKLKVLLFSKKWVKWKMQFLWMLFYYAAAKLTITPAADSTQLFSSLISLVSLTPKSKLQQKELNLAHGRNKNQKNTTKKCGNVCFCLSFPHFFLNFFGLFSFSPFSK